MIPIAKGTKDVLPQDSFKWHYIENLLRDIARCFNAQEIRTPTFEHTELFLRGVGETSDVVSKEMYTFLDKGNRSITLKPEGTAGVARSYIENGLANISKVQKMYYITPVYRYEKPQAGRLRQHHQFGVEVYGEESAIADAEVIAIVDSIFKELKVTDISLNINSLGCKDCRQKYNTELKAYFNKNIEGMCKTCNDRLDKNPLRILDCKNEKCIELASKAPTILDFICDDCNTHFKELQASLDMFGIKYEIDSRIVRGLDYYNRTVFEFVTNSIGAKSTVCGGGRYDTLLESVGGKATPAVGFGMGLERLLLLLDNQKLEIENKEKLQAFIVCGEGLKSNTVELASKLRSDKISCDFCYDNKNFKNQFKRADKSGCEYAIIIGEDEIKNKCYTLKNMKSGEQTQGDYKKIKEILKGE